MELTINECAAFLAAHDDYLIISHKRPDGDTLGSGAALCSALRRAGKTAYCLENPESAEIYRPFIAPYLAREGLLPSLAVTVDVADTAMFPDNAPESVCLAIDHHGTNSRFAERTCVQADRAACGEIVLKLIKKLCGGVTKDEADLLYIALSTDTGCFQYSNTDAEALGAASELVGLGADNSSLNIAIFRTMSPARLALHGAILSGLRYFRNGEICVATVTLETLRRTGATEDDCEDIAGLSGKARGAIIGMTVREIAENESKISMRSKPGVNVASMCAEFGGGGHTMAAGCTLKCPPEEAVRRMVAVAQEKWPG